MARKETITKSEILNTAFQMARQEGVSQVSARTLATKAGCSTQPIFRLYKNMEELGNELYDKAIEFSASIMKTSRRHTIRLLSIWDWPIFVLHRKSSSYSSCCLFPRTVTVRVCTIS